MQYNYANDIFGDTVVITKQVQEILHDLSNDLDEDLKFDLRLVLSELLINCHEHGNECDTKKPIHLNIKINDDEIDILVKDEGEGIISRKIYKATDYKSHGRGLILVEKLVDFIEINKNKIRCKILINKK